MKIALGEKVNYYEVCPYCGTPRGEGKESCEKCGKSLILDVEKKKEDVDDSEDVSLYRVRDEKSASQTFKSLKGKNKARYFVDYYLAKVIIAVIVLSLLGSLAYTMLKPRPKSIFNVAVVVSPFIPASLDQFEEDLTNLFVKDKSKEMVSVDTGYVSLVADYNSMVSYTMHLAAQEIDMVILTKDELKYQVNNQSLISVESVISKEILDKIDESAKYKVTPAYLKDSGEAEYGEEEVYGLNIESFLARINGFETSNKYCIGFTAVKEHTDKFDEVVKYMFDIK